VAAKIDGHDMQVYERMQEQELEATATTYTALVSAYCKSDDLDAALEVRLMLCSGRMQFCSCTQHMGN